MHRPSVLHVIDSDGFYGAENVVLNLMEEQSRQGLHTKLASVAEPGVPQKAIEAEAQKRGLIWQRFDVKKGFDITGMRRICSAAEAGNISIIHSHGYKPNILLAMLRPKRCKLPVVATLHGWTTKPGLSRMRMYRWLECELLPRLDRVVAVCNAMTEGTRFSRRLENRLSVIHNGIPDLAAEPDIELDRRLSEFAAGRPILLMATRLSPEKNLPMAIRAVSELAKHGHSVSLAIFGEGPERERLEQLLQELELHNSVRLFGYNSAAPTLLKCATALLVTSTTEGVPIVLLEAMRASVPIISTAVGGIPEVLQHEESALLIRSENVDELAHAVARLISDKKLRREIANAARKTFVESHTEEEIYDNYNQLYEGLTCA